MLKANQHDNLTVTIKQNVDAKNFLYHEAFHLKNAKELLPRYKLLTIHGSINGIFIPPIWSIYPVKPMGSLWKKAKIHCEANN